MDTQNQQPPVARRRRRSQAGMTLIEIMVVLAIISLILGGVGVMAFNRFKDAQLEDARNNAVQVQQLSEQYQLQKRKCPRNVQELKAAGFAAREAKDPWGAEFEIRCEQGAIEVVSSGPDGQANSEDDISSNAAAGGGQGDADAKGGNNKK
ncbi:MAG: prepilin-type N-terminal cleavage/methylation domain-containing protein [Deltaproteobacteria bacterium]|nr:prepilin-type N-terminal cleavage/methylation domain-containing protein [Nannocystaceae bacterium]